MPGGSTQHTRSRNTPYRIVQANLSGAAPQRVFGRFTLSHDSDEPDISTNQMIYSTPNLEIVFVDSCQTVPPEECGKSRHMQAWMIKNPNTSPTSDNYPVIGASLLRGQLKWNSTTELV